MEAFDVILGEFDEPIAQDSTWQVVARLVPQYKRPPEQPPNDDPSPPYYLARTTPRGPWFFCAFEWVGEYNFVRGRQNADDQAVRRQYLRSLGCRYTG